MRGTSIGEWFLSRRDSTIVARHEVPGKASSKEPSRRGRYERVPLTAHVRPKAFSNIRIQEPNTFLCAENAMDAQAREGVCHGKEFHRRPESYHINCFSFVLEFCHPIIESVHPPAPITPYPTGRLFWVALFQALRARLRSHRPSGTFCHRL